MTIPNNLPPNICTRLTLLFSEWNGRLEVREMHSLEIREMPKDIQDMKTLIVSGNPAEKEDD